MSFSARILFPLSICLLSFCLFSCDARTHKCNGDWGEFECMDQKRTQLWGRQCVRNEAVCDGNYDCQDHSDEWEFLCAHQCYRREDIEDRERVYRGFSCEILSRESRLDQDASLYNAQNATSPQNQEYANSEEKEVKNYEFAEETTEEMASDNKTLRWPSNYRCLPLNSYCDFKWDCWDRDFSETTPVDEMYCECYENDECDPQTDHPRYNPNWWIQILATTIAIIALFGFCVCVAAQWEKHRLRHSMRQRAMVFNRNRETASRRTASARGHRNLGATFETSEIQGNIGAPVMAPPPYSMAMALPKPEDRSFPAELPPPYEQEWTGSLQFPAARTAIGEQPSDQESSSTRHTTPQHTVPQQATPTHTTPPHTSPQHTPPQHTTPQPDSLGHCSTDLQGARNSVFVVGGEASYVLGPPTGDTPSVALTPTEV